MDYKKDSKNEIAYSELWKILENPKIDNQNAIEYYNSQRNEGCSQQKDGYELLVGYIKQHPNNTYYHLFFLYC